MSLQTVTKDAASFFLFSFLISRLSLSPSFSVARYHEFLPWCTSSRVLHRFGPRKFDAELSVGFQGLYSESYISRVLLTPPSRVQVTMHSSPILKSLTNDWHLQPSLQGGGSIVTFQVAFEFRNAVHATAAKFFFQEVHSRMLDAFLKRAQQLEGQGYVPVTDKY